MSFAVSGLDERTVRVSLTVPESLRTDLDIIATRLGVSRSALVTNLLLPGISDLITLLDLLPDEPSENDLLRARGKSVELIGARIAEVFTAEGDGE